MSCRSRRHAVQELGYALAAGVERLAAAATVDDAARAIEFVFAGRADLFSRDRQVARRALLWAQAVAAFGRRTAMRPAACASTCAPARNKSVYDRYTNLLRVTTEALAAAVGGCDTLTVEPFGFDSHLAVNVERILQG
jgi:methylmalonyl-CoA mutase